MTGIDLVRIYARSTPPAPANQQGAFPGHLPSPLDHLVGRARELAALRGVLQRPEVRLVTLSGPGGVGKSRLALELAREVAGNVVFVPLVSVTDIDLVPLAIAQRLGLRNLGSRPAEVLIRVLRNEPAMLVLDNVDHLIAAMPLVSELLAGCPSLTVVATSRTRLRLSGEHEFPVPPLEVPAEPCFDAEEISEIASNASVALFVERASAADSGFRLTSENCRTVAEICRRLDGLPLAIELAAARSRLLPPEAMLARLSTRLGFLTGGPRDVPDRQRTMRDAIAWSYDQLTSDEKALFRRLGVFVGGCTLEAVGAVHSEGGAALLDEMAALVDHSALVRKPGDSAEPRYVMLETIREYALEQLGALEREEAAGRHARYYLELAERAAAEFETRTQARWLDWMAIERANLGAALEWLRGRGDIESALRLAAALGLFHWCRGHHSEARTTLEATLAMPGAHLQGAAWAAAMTGLGVQMSMQGDNDGAAETHRAAVEGWRRQRQPEGLARALWFQGLDLLGTAPDAAGEAFEESLALARRLGTPWIIAYALWGIAHVTRIRGDLATAQALVEEGKAVLGDAGNQTAGAATLWILGQLAWGRGDEREAIRLHGEALQAFREIGKPWGGVDCVEALAFLCGQPERAARLLAAADAWRDAVGMPRPPLARPGYEEMVAAVRGRVNKEAFDRAWREGQHLRPAAVLAEALAIAAGQDELPQGLRQTADQKHLGLTPRELDVLRLISEGRSDRQIAAALSISPRTVGGHVTHILGKLGVDSRNGATAFALRNGLA